MDLADAYRIYEVQYHDGGLHEADALRMYEILTAMVEERRDEAMLRRESQKMSTLEDGKDEEDVGRRMPGTIHRSRDVYDEMTAPYPDRSWDGLLCAAYTSQGKALYMANMFSKSVVSYSRCLDVDPEYLDALDARASSYIVLGSYEEAAADYGLVIERDENRLLFSQAYTGLARVLEVRENATVGGWQGVVDRLNSIIPRLEARLDVYPQGRNVLAPTLNRLHHVVRTVS
jgi:tetratricopeptide (TPR) repeat protein